MEIKVKSMSELESLYLYGIISAEELAVLKIELQKVFQTKGEPKMTRREFVKGLTDAQVLEWFENFPVLLGYNILKAAAVHNVNFFDYCRENYVDMLSDCWGEGLYFKD